MAAEANGDVFPWLKSLPVAPEYHPTAAEFKDPIRYIFKIEKEASKYGICKIIPPFPPSSKKTAIANLNRSLTVTGPDGVDPTPTFTTRQQQIGFCPRRPRPVQRPVWQSGENYTFHEFEAKAKSFERTYLKRHHKKGSGSGSSSGLSALETETLFWKATVDKPFTVEYANDMPGSAFSAVAVAAGSRGRKCREAGEAVTVAETEWNMRGVSRAKGSLLRFMKEEIPGVTSPMVYVAMLFSWFAWHVEDHDLHSLNYLHMGAGKTWYGVPRDAAVAFEEVVRVHGYGGEINPLVTFAILGEKTTVMSPEVFISAGVPCCRLVQNAGEFVVTFPRAYHTGFSHGFNCGEAANIATPEWLRVAKDAAIRRASINYPPMVSHFQLLYDLALALCSRIPGGISAEPRSSRLKDKKKSEGESVIKELFVQDVLQNNDLLHVLGKESAVILLPRSTFDTSVCSKLRVGSQQLKGNPGISLSVFNPKGMNSAKGFISDDLVFNKNHGIKQEKGFCSLKDKFTKLCERNRISSCDVNGSICTSSSKPLQSVTERETSQGDGLSDHRLFSCVRCGMLSFSCVAIVQPREPAARYLMSADCSFFNDWIVGSGISSNKFTIDQEDATVPKPNMYTGWTEKNARDGLYSVPVQSTHYRLQTANRNYEEALDTETEKGNTALALLASAYGNSSDSEEDHGDPDIGVDVHQSNVIDCTSGRLPSHFQDSHASTVTRLDRGDDIPSNCANYDDYKHRRFECNLSYQSFDHSFEKQECDITSGVTFKNTRTVPNSASNYSQDAHDAEKSLLVNAMVPNPVDNKNASLVPQSDEDSSRLHIFCLEHAAEAEQQLHPIGGAHILLLCHPDYPKIEAEAKLVAEDLRIDYMWKNISYRHATKEDEERIQTALDSEEAIPGNGDWAVKLGINLFYSANLSRSPLYSKQMPYNSVIYYAFGRSSPASSPIEPKVYQRRANKQKKVVAGKWCGKVWMSNQVHPLLAKTDSEDVEDEISLDGWILPDEKIERSESIPKSEITIRKLSRKRKMTLENRRSRKSSFAEIDVVSNNSSEDKPNKQPRRIIRTKQAKHIEPDVAALEGNYSPLYHRRKPSSRRTNCTGSDAVSDDLLDDNYLMQHTRNVKVRKAKPIDNDVVSDDTMDSDSNCPQGGELSSMQVEDTERDAISDDSLDVDSLCQHRKAPKSKRAKFISEDVISDDQTKDHIQKQQRRIPKSRKGIFRTEKDMISDDQVKQHMQKQQQRNRKNRQAKYLAGEDIISNDQLEGHYCKSQRRIPKGRQARCIAMGDVMSDDQLKDHFQKQQTPFARRRQKKDLNREVKDEMSDDQLEGRIQKQQRSFPRSRQKKHIDGEVMDDSAENNSQLLHKTPKRKQFNCVDEDDIVSDDEEEHDSHQQHRRILRSKQSKPRTLQQMKQANSLQLENQTSQPVKRGARMLVKSKAPQKIKQSPVRNKDSGGPSTRLRKRVTKGQESEEKSKEKQTKRKKVKNATTAKVSACHAKIKDEETDYQCDIDGCTMSFVSKQDLMHHKKNICPVKGCGKKFFSHKYLVQHRRVHEDDRPLRCPWKGCKMTFKWAWARTEHIRVHTGARPYVCAEPGCGQTFRFVSDFSRHKRKTGHSAKKSC